MGLLNNFRRTGTSVLKLLFCLIFVLCMVPVFGLAVTAKADGGLQISTAYPGTTVKAGADTNFTITVNNTSGTPQNVALSCDTPTGWTGYFSGGGATITRVYVDNGAKTDVTFNLSIPADAAENKYPVTIHADGQNASSTFPLELTVSKSEVSTGKFTAQFSSLAGSNSTTFKFSTTITNDTTSDQTYSLSANVPQGWTATFTPSYETQQVASISVTAGNSQGVDVSITPSASAPAGKNTITCTAVSAQATLSLDLEVQITGTYKMTMATQSNVLSGSSTAGSDAAVALTITNSGSVDLNNVNLTATAPTNWTVTFDQPTISTIAAGQAQTVTAHIKSASNAIVGDYNVYFSAATNETNSQLVYRLSLQTSSTWWIIAGIVIVALAVGLTVLFTKLGRR